MMVIEEGLILTVAGMGITLAFLWLMVGAMQGMAWFVQRYTTHGAVTENTASVPEVGTADADAAVAVAIAAVAARQKR